MRADRCIGRRDVSITPETCDRGVATPVEMMMVLIVCLVAVMFVSFLGRLHAAGVEVTTVAQSAARAASLASGPTSALSWERSDLGTWRGGSVTVRITCIMDNARLAAVWAPGRRTVGVSDTQRIDVYRP